MKVMANAMKADPEVKTAINRHEDVEEISWAYITDGIYGVIVKVTAAR